MTQRNPLVLVAGELQQLQSGDTIPTGLTSGHRNAAINGQFDLWQRGAGSTLGVNNKYSADRWKIGLSLTGGVNWQRSTDVPTAAQATVLSNFSMKLTVQTTQASIGAGNYFIIDQPIEGYIWSWLAQRPITLSFWAKAHVAATYCAALRNTAPDRSYVVEFTIANADTWQYFTFNIPASPSAGTWNYSNGTGIHLSFAFACGSTFQTTANAWQTGNLFGTSNQANGLSAATNNLLITQVQLEQGDVATNFELRPFGTELLLCQRYYFKTFQQNTAPANNTNDSVGSLTYHAFVAAANTCSWRTQYPVQMRTTPTVTYFNPNNTNSNWRNQTLLADSGTPVSINSGADSVQTTNPQVAGDAVGNNINVHLTADAEL